MRGDEVLFVGDRDAGGNDYPVKALGIPCVEVEKWQETAIFIRALICTLEPAAAGMPMQAAPLAFS